MGIYNILNLQLFFYKREAREWSLTFISSGKDIVSKSP